MREQRLDRELKKGGAESLILSFVAAINRVAMPEAA
jgi:hypothetical protein